MRGGWDAHCDRCGKPVCFDHDPPCPHGVAICDTCERVDACPDCRREDFMQMCLSGTYTEAADPFLRHLREPQPFRPLSDFCTQHNSKRYACKEKHR